MKASDNYRYARNRTGRYNHGENIRNISYSRTGYRGQYSTGRDGAGRITFSAASRGMNRGYGYSSYNYTSVAHDYSYRSYEHTSRNKAAVTRPRKKERTLLSLSKTYVTIAILFTFTLSFLCAQASNTGRREEIASMRAQLAAIEADNEYLRTSIEDNIDLKALEQEAVKLGMQKPAEYQLMKINVPKESYTVQYDTKPQTEEQSFIEFIKSWFKD